MTRKEFVKKYKRWGELHYTKAPTREDAINIFAKLKLTGEFIQVSWGWWIALEGE